jgi:hypothetical protein
MTLAIKMLINVGDPHQYTYISRKLKGKIKKEVGGK